MRAFVVAVLLTLAVTAGAAVPATDLYLVSVGHTPGVCVGGVCAQWRSDAWVFNPSAIQSAVVEIIFLPRGGANNLSQRHTYTVLPGETREFADIILAEFGADPAAGSLRVTSNIPVVATARIYDANVVTNKGSGTAGAYLAGQPAGTAIGVGESVDLVGLAQDAQGGWRTNIGLLETSGHNCTLEVQRIDEAGTPLANLVTVAMAQLESRQVPIADLGGAAGTNQRVRVRVTAGSGRVLALADRIDNLTGDPATVEMGGATLDGAWIGKLDKGVYDTAVTVTVAATTVTAVDATIVFTDEDVSTCASGELIRLAGNLPQPVLIEDGAFSFSLSGTVGGVAVTLTFAGAVSPAGRLSGTVTTTPSGAGTSQQDFWPRSEHACPDGGTTGTLLRAAVPAVTRFAVVSR
jgi:hypothetical protein